MVSRPARFASPGPAAVTPYRREDDHRLPIACCPVPAGAIRCSAVKVLIADKLGQAGMDYLRRQDDVEVAVRPGLAPAELAAVVGDFDGMIVRSGVKVTAEVLAESGRLRCIARAGVGVDNIDVPTATAKGIIVMNTPGGNTLSTAELTMALMLDLSRKVAPASASLRRGEWDRKAYEGTQLAGKVLGIIGVGRIGRAVADRAAAFGMRVLGYDPHLAGRPAEFIEMVSDLQALCRSADYITVHAPGTPEAMGLIGPEQLAVMKPTVRLINCARGGIIDPQALLAALEAGRVAGAALDVYTAEPPVSAAEQALIQHPSVLAVPHLGASTGEAQEQVALEAAEQLVEALRGGAVRNAVNAPGFDRALPPELRPFAELARHMGAILAHITPGAVRKVEVICRGAIGEAAATPLATCFLVGLLQPHLAQPVNVVNAPVLAERRGIEVSRLVSAKAEDFASVLQAVVHTDRTRRSAMATLYGRRPRVIAIDGYHMELNPQGHVLIIFWDDLPGMVGKLGTLLGRNAINIADMTVSRKLQPRKVVVGVNLDQSPLPEVMAEIHALGGVHEAYCLELRGPEGLPAGEAR